jgi:hypothetical protein
MLINRISQNVEFSLWIKYLCRCRRPSNSSPPGDSVMFTSQISFTTGNQVIVNVVADVISPKRYDASAEHFLVSKFKKTTNIFRFAFRCPDAPNIRQVNFQ